MNILRFCESGDWMSVCVDTKNPSGYLCPQGKPQQEKTFGSLLYLLCDFSDSGFDERWPCAEAPFTTIFTRTFLTWRRNAAVIAWRCKQSSRYCSAGHWYHYHTLSLLCCIGLSFSKDHHPHRCIFVCCFVGFSFFYIITKWSVSLFTRLVNIFLTLFSSSTCRSILNCQEKVVPTLQSLQPSNSGHILRNVF